MKSEPLLYFVVVVAAFIFMVIMLVMNSQSAMREQGRLPDQNETYTPEYTKYLDEQGGHTAGFEIRFGWILMIGFAVLMLFAAVALFLRSLFKGVGGGGGKRGGWG